MFNQPQSPEAFTDDFNHLPSTEVSQIQEDSFVLEAMGIQRKPRANLIEVMESQVMGKAPEAVAQAKLPSLPPPYDP